MKLTNAMIENFTFAASKQRVSHAIARPIDK
jgi:hypothetical protein